MRTKKARELVPGDRILWPYGDTTATVKSVQPDSGGWLHVYAEGHQLPHIAKPDADLAMADDVSSRRELAERFHQARTGELDRRAAEEIAADLD